VVKNRIGFQKKRCLPEHSPLYIAQTDQLTDTDHSYQTDETYSYDANGNRTNAGYQTGSNNQLLSNGTYNYTYDNEGNRTSRINIATGEVTQYTWDYRNRLTSVITQDSSGTIIKSVEYAYDAYNRRIAKVIVPMGQDRQPHRRSEWSTTGIISP
jgi:YD repeat-containing protein